MGCCHEGGLWGLLLPVTGTPEKVRACLCCCTVQVADHMLDFELAEQPHHKIVSYRRPGEHSEGKAGHNNKTLCSCT